MDKFMRTVETIDNILLENELKFRIKEGSLFLVDENGVEKSYVDVFFEATEGKEPRENE